MRRLIVAVLLALALAHPVSAAPQSLTLPSGYPTGGEKQNPVEQQTDWPWMPGTLDCSDNVNCVVNPTGCAWDVDDHWQHIQIGRTLAASTTITGTVCQVYDANPNYRTICAPNFVPPCITSWWSTNRARFGFELIASSPDVVITLGFPEQGRLFSLAPVLEGKLYHYRWCGNAVYNPGDPALAPIPGSAGGPNNAEGVGLQSDIVMTVTNPTRRTMRDVAVDIQSVGTGAGYSACIVNVTYDQQQHDYPFAWTQS